MKRYDVDVQKN